MGVVELARMLRDTAECGSDAHSTPSLSWSRAVCGECKLFQFNELVAFDTGLTYSLFFICLRARCAKRSRYCF